MAGGWVLDPGGRGATSRRPGARRDRDRRGRGLRDGPGAGPGRGFAACCVPSSSAPWTCVRHAGARTCRPTFDGSSRRSGRGGRLGRSWTSSPRGCRPRQATRGWPPARLRFVAPPILEAARPESELAVAAPRTASTLREIVAALDVAMAPDPTRSANDPATGAASPATGAADLSLSGAAAVADLGSFVLPLARRGRASVLKRSSPYAETLRDDVRTWRSLESEVARTRTAAAGWHAPLAPDDARAALAIATAKEGSLLRFFDGGWRRVKAVVAAGFTPGRRAVPVPTSTALALLVAQHDAEAALEGSAVAAQEAWGYRDVGELAARIDALHKPEDVAVATWRDRLAASEDDDLAGALADAGTRSRTSAARARPDAAGRQRCVARWARSPSWTRSARARPGAPCGPSARRFDRSSEHPEVARALRRLPGRPDEIEYAVCAAALEDAVASRPTLGELRWRATRRSRGALPGPPADPLRSRRRGHRRTRAPAIPRRGRPLESHGHGHVPGRPRPQEGVDHGSARTRERVPQGHALPSRSATSHRARPGRSSRRFGRSG